ncbi:MAG: hypothetical protein LUE86_11400 [Clostridiales bacterium]|nr:hypothetical protein [Clostridiales bacterium]
MTKEQVRYSLFRGQKLAELFEFCDTSEGYVIYKAPFEVGEKVIYIPDIFAHEIEIAHSIPVEDVNEVVSHLYTGNDILAICGGNEALARYMYGGLTWLLPESELDSLELENDDAAMLEICGKTWHGLFPATTNDYKEVTI